jgi:hypothetical protein
MFREHRAGRAKFGSRSDQYTLGTYMFRGTGPRM